MAYKVNITDNAGEQYDRLISYLINNLDNLQAARHLNSSIATILNRLEANPLQFPLCVDETLGTKRLRKAIVKDMDYLVIFNIDEKCNIVHVLGIFHGLENYFKKI